MEIDHTITGCEQSRRDQLLLQEQLSEQNRTLREIRIRNMRDMEELQKSHVFKVEELSRRKLTEDQNTVMELRAQIQELQNEVNCMNDSRDFKDAESQSAARYLEFAGYIGKRFCKSTSIFFVTLSRRSQSLDFYRYGRHTCTHKYGATRYMC